MFHIAGVVPFTTIDFPNNLAGVIFFKGCPLRCPFCHNPALQEFSEGEETWENVCAFFKERVRRLDGVVLSGGEPLMQSDIIQAVKTFKDMGYNVAIHTSGVYPEKLKQIASMLDWVGLDVKAPWDKYEILSGRPNIVDKVKQSIEILQDAHVPFETRTTCDPRYLTLEDIERLTDELRAIGVSHYAMQKYRTFDGDKNPPSMADIEAFFNNAEWVNGIREKFQSFLTRE